MIVVETVLGNVDDPRWKVRLASARIDYLEMDQWEAQKSRFRKKTSSGAEFAISLDRGSHIHDGDILQWHPEDNAAVVARIDVRDVMVIHLDELRRLDPQLAMRTCIELGHAMGNQHWPALVKDSTVYVPLVLARKVMDSVMRTHSFENIRYEFVTGREVIPYLAPHETRRLSGAAEGAAHSHVKEKYALTHDHAADVSLQLKVAAKRRQKDERNGLDEASAVQLARTFQFGDSTFPMGAFSFSCGLESAIQAGVVKCVASLREFTMTAVEQSVRGDAIALLCAHRAAEQGDIDELVMIDEQVMARKVSEESRTMTTRMGRKFVELSASLIDNDVLVEWRDRIQANETPGSYPVALAIAFAIQGLSGRSAFAVHQYGVAATILSAALRLIKVSHLDTQKILYDVNKSSEKSFSRAEAARLSDMAGFSPLLDILTAVHTKAHVRLFMN